MEEKPLKDIDLSSIMKTVKKNTLRNNNSSNKSRSIVEVLGNINNNSMGIDCLYDYYYNIIFIIFFFLFH